MTIIILAVSSSSSASVFHTLQHGWMQHGAIEEFVPLSLGNLIESTLEA